MIDPRAALVEVETPRPVTVLIADDDEGARSALRLLLVSEGYEVIEASDGSAALEILARAADGETRPPDVVLLDFVMPGLSGLGVLRIMHRFRQPPPTIIMTAFPDPSVDVFASNLGALRVIHKPLDADVVVAVVRQAARMFEMMVAPRLD